METNNIKTKNRNIFILLTIVFTFCSFGLLILDNILKLNSYLFMFGGLLLFTLQDFLTLFISKKITKEKVGLLTCVNVFDWLCIIMIGLIALFNSNSLLITFIIVKVIVWLISVKLILKDVIKNKIIIIIGLVLFFIIVLLKNLLLMPSEVNKNLFLKYGKTDFSSKIIYTQLIDEYNNNSSKKVNYFYELTNEDLSQIIHLSYSDTTATLTNKDLVKLNNLETLTISGLVEPNLDLSNNKKIKTFGLVSEQEIKNIVLNENVENILIKNELDTLDISNLLNLKSLKVKTNNLKVINLNQILNSNTELELKKLTTVLGNNIRISNNFLKFEIYPQIKKDILIPNNSAVDNIISNGFEIEVYNSLTNELREVNEKIENRDLLKINLDGNTLTTFNVKNY